MLMADADFVFRFSSTSYAEASLIPSVFGRSPFFRLSGRRAPDGDEGILILQAIALKAPSS